MKYISQFKLDDSLGLATETNAVIIGGHGIRQCPQKLPIAWQIHYLIELPVKYRKALINIATIVKETATGIWER